MDLGGILANISAFTGPQQPDNGPLEAPVAVAHIPATGAANGVAAVLFSRDRPYQLQQLLRSMEAFATGIDAVYVLYRCSEQWAAQYEVVFSGHTNVVAVQESSFEEDLREVVIGKLQQHVGSVLFVVDDALFTSSVDISGFANILHATPDAFTAQLKLHPGIVFSHPAVSACTRPPLRVHSGPEAPDLCLVFDLRSGSHDWSYPFDLCGGLYRLEDVKRVLEAARGQIHNPNVFEVAGNKVWRNTQGCRPSRGLCCAKQALVVVTTNKVQDTFDVPVYTSPQGELEALNATQEPLAPRAYANKSYFLAHVGDLFFEVPASLSQPQLSVVIPAYNAAHFLPGCLHSLEQQRGVLFELIVVDDGSEDGTFEVLQQFNKHRTNENCVEMRVLRIGHEGLVGALNTGIAAARNNVIVRLDADDMCLPNRLSRQLEFLMANPNITVLGAQAAQFSDPPDTESTVMTAPTHPVLAQWRLFLESPLLHPTVCFRRDLLLPQATEGESELYNHDIVLSAQDNDQMLAQARDLLETGGFTNSGNGLLTTANCVEDLQLWCRLAAARPFCIASVPDVLLAYRVHPEQKSRMEFEKATAQATVVLWTYIKQALGEHLPATVSIRHLHVLRKPTRTRSIAELEGAHKLLSSLHSQFKAQVEVTACARSTVDELSQYALDVVAKSVAGKARELGAAAMRVGPISEARKFAEAMGLTSAELLQSVLLATLSS